MAGKDKPLNKGQSKEHEVFDTEGNPLSMAQKDWRARDKSAGLTRPEEEEAIIEEEAPVVDSETTPS